MCNFFFLPRFPFRITDDSHCSKGREGTVFIPLRTFRHLFATLYLKWLHRIFNSITSNFQTATWWALSPLGINIWLIVSGGFWTYITPLKANRLTKGASHLQVSPRYFVAYISLFEAFYSFNIKNWKSFTFYASNSSSCKHNGAIFYKHRNPFNFVSNIFFISLHGRITEETFTFSLK